jgi:uncharacterized membrane protein YhaH (DUF805 family)
MRLISMHFKSLTQFYGREARKDFWPWVGICIAFYALSFFGLMIYTFAAFDPQSSSSLRLDMTGMIAANGAICAVIVALLAAAVARRLHDCSRSGAWGLLPLPNLTLGMVMMMRVTGDLGASEGDMGPVFMLFLNNMLYIILLLVLVVLCAQAGTKDDNRFGPPPV